MAGGRYGDKTRVGDVIRGCATAELEIGATHWNTTCVHGNAQPVVAHVRLERIANR